MKKRQRKKNLKGLLARIKKGVDGYYQGYDPGLGERSIIQWYFMAGNTPVRMLSPEEAKGSK